MLKNTNIKLWDLATRLFHWLLVTAFCMAWYAGKNEIMWLHYYAAYTIMTLVIFRIFWGFLGSSTSKFSSFFPTPSKIRKYLPTIFTKKPSNSLGHNPVGALSVFAILGLLITQISFGLFAQDSDFIDSGPLSDLISFSAASAALDWHEKTFDLSLFVIGLHIAAILFYRFYKKDNLIKPMITGYKKMDTPIINLQFKSPALALLMLGISALITWGVVSLLPHILELH